MNLQTRRAQKNWRNFKIFRIFWLLALTAITALNIYDQWRQQKPFDWTNIWALAGFVAFMGVFSVFYYAILKFVDGILSDKEKNPQ